MTDSVFSLFGGVGLFLLGMTLLTDGLKSFAGESLRRILIKLTGNPFTALLTGVVGTALVQSSSATVVTMIGFVSAGVIALPQALGVVLGATLGSTSIGWLVSSLGLQISIGYYALPLVGVGAFIRLLAPPSWRTLGFAIAGFALIFVGISTLQESMVGLEVDFRMLPGGLLGRFLGVGVGIAMTLIMQSSSAAIATVITALHTESISFEQAALFVIGASIGTAVTSSLAAIGASVNAKRTALALVLFTLVSGTLALLMLPLHMDMLHWAQNHLGLASGALSLAAFHTTFAAIGVALLFPAIPLFARIVEKLLPESGDKLTANLDKSLMNLPDVALDTLRRALKEIARYQFALVADALRGERSADLQQRKEQVELALQRAQDFFSRIPPVSHDQGISSRRLAVLHALDHLVRLIPYCQAPSHVKGLHAHARLSAALDRTIEMLQRADVELADDEASEWNNEFEKIADDLAALSFRERPELLRETAGGNGSPNSAIDALDALRWLSKVTNHVWRIVYYLENIDRASIDATPEAWARHEEP